MNIEILLTEAEIASEFADALEAKDLPEKFFYWFPLSVRKWRGIASGPDYFGLQEVWTAVSGRVATRIDHFGPEIPVVSLGAGDGAKDRLLLKAVERTGRQPKYFPVDASQGLLEVACAAAEEDEFEVLGIKADISSRMHILLAADVAEAPRLFLLAGNTLGGFDPLELVTNLAEAMRTGDILMIDGELDSPESARVVESEPVRELAFSPLASIGVHEEDGRVRFERKRDSRHEGLCLVTKYFHAERDVRVRVFSQEMAIARGERIFMNFRYLCSPEAFTWLLEEHAHLTVEEQILSSDGRFVGAICTK